MERRTLKNLMCTVEHHTAQCFASQSPCAQQFDVEELPEPESLHAAMSQAKCCHLLSCLAQWLRHHPC